MEILILSNDGEIVRLLIRGQVVQATLSSPEPLSEALGGNGYCRRVVLSLAETTFIDSSGIGWLLGCNKRFREGGGKLVIHSVPPIVLDMLRVMRLHEVLKVADDESGALAMIRGDKP